VLPPVFHYKEANYVHLLTSDLVTGERMALYKLSSGDSKVREIEILEAFQKRSANYQIRLRHEDGVVLSISADSFGHAKYEAAEVDGVSGAERLAALARDPSVVEKLLPPMAMPAPRAETPFDQKYAAHIKLRDSGVAVFDSGIDYTRRDQMATAMINEGEIPGDGIDNDANGVVDDRLGYHFGLDKPYTHDWGYSYHGPMVTEIVSRASPRVKVLPIRQQFLGTVDSVHFEDAIAYIKEWNRRNPDRPVRVINMSFSSQEPAMPNLVRIIRENPDLIFVAAAGNKLEGERKISSFPASYKFPNLIAVASVNSKDEISSFSARGPNVDVSDVGEVELFNVHGKREATQGTSFSAPAVAALIAEWVLLKPDLTAEQVRVVLLSSLTSASDPLQLFKPDPRERLYTAGRVDREKSYALVLNLAK
jgi:subtilisin family serine protease